MDDNCNCCEHREQLGRRALVLSWVTLGYNIVEGAISLVAGGLASSIALIGFGLDSFTESLSGGIMIWRFSQRRLSAEQEQRVEARAVKLIGWSFLVLAGYVLFESTRKLIAAEQPDPSLPGIIIAAVSLVTMPTLFLFKRATSRKLASRSLLADSKQTLACTLMSAALLAGLLAHRLFGFWQADPLIGLGIGGWLVKEGVAALREGRLCSC